MFIDIWDKGNKAIKINEFTAYNINNDWLYVDGVNKLVSDYGIVFSGSYIKTDNYYIYFSNGEEDQRYYGDKLKFLTLFDCYTFLISDNFHYVFDNERITWIEIKAGNKTMFKYDDRG